ncbi:glycosyl hydrolase family 47-domain-containing protein [Pelagophyceae sp. CCMP2097]|nr:glycosyl hydrolase family 47-domain-containing protein [Pelagophyceae sp. CCMP2097]
MALAVLLCAWASVGEATIAQRRRDAVGAAQDATLSPLEGACASFARDGDWWRYRWCHKGGVAQYHDGVDGARAEVSLGTYSAAHSGETHAFVNGAVCGAHSRGPGRGAGPARRQTTVRFKCCEPRNESARLHNVLSHETRNVWLKSVSEPEECAYELVVCAQLVCAGRNSTGYRQMVASRRSLKRRGPMSARIRLHHRELVRAMFYRGYDSYMKHAFPDGELKSLSCSGRRFELSKLPLVTLIDALDTLAILGDAHEFQRGIELISLHLKHFRIDVNVSVFETTIRVLGGLVSSHMLAVDASLNLTQDLRQLDNRSTFVQSKFVYSDQLLLLAVDLAERLLPAFETPTGIPYGTVNLALGVPNGETVISSLAGAGSLSLEFCVLSALTGDPRFCSAASGAVQALFQRRSANLHLLGKHINIRTGKWVERVSGIGSNSDSFYEYLLKMYLLFGDSTYWRMFTTTYSGVLRHLRHGDWYSDVDMFGGAARQRRDVFEGLQAFWPGVQALSGDSNLAARSLNAFYVVWNDFGALPEEFDFNGMKLITGRASAMRSPLRPELIESTWILRNQHQDPTWLWAASDYARDVDAYTQGVCGHASIRNVASGALDDEMPSYFLSESVKYLYLIFDEENFINKKDYVLSTEAHPFDVDAVQRLARRNSLARSAAAAAGDVPAAEAGAAPDGRPETERVEDEGPWPQSLTRLVWLWCRRLTALALGPPDDAAAPQTSHAADDDEDDEDDDDEEFAQVSLQKSMRCAARNWWAPLGYNRAFDNTVENAVAGRSVILDSHERCFREDAPSPEALKRSEAKFLQKAAHKLQRKRVSSDAMPRGVDMNEMTALQSEAPASGAVRVDVADLGLFDVEVFEDGFRVSRVDTDEALELTNVGAPVMLATVGTGDAAHVAMVSSDGRQMECKLKVQGLPELGCSVAAFGLTALFAANAQVSSFDLQLHLEAPPGDATGCKDLKKTLRGNGVKAPSPGPPAGAVDGDAAGDGDAAPGGAAPGSAAPGGAAPGGGVPGGAPGPVAVARGAFAARGAFVARGGCMFEEKAILARRSGFDALVVFNSVQGQHRFIMSNSTTSLLANRYPSASDSIATVMIPFEDGTRIEAALSAASAGLPASLRLRKHALGAASPVHVDVAEGFVRVVGPQCEKSAPLATVVLSGMRGRGRLRAYVKEVTTEGIRERLST